MSNKKNKVKFSEQKPSTSRHVLHHENNEKKDKKTVPSNSNLDFNSFPSSTTQLSLEEDLHHENLIVNQEVNISVLLKYLNAPIREVSPRSVFIKPCSQSPLELEKSSIFPSASSCQLFEKRNSSNINEVNWYLLSATYLRKIRAVKGAIRKGADVNILLEMQTPLMIATESGDTRLVAYLLSVPNIKVDLKNKFGHTPLMLAVANGFDSIVRLLLKNNADVNLPDNMGKTPLHSALFQQRVGLVKLLLAFGANYEIADCFGEKPMYTAAVKKPNLECLKALLKMGARPDYMTISGITLLSRTILNGTEFKIIEALVNYGASVNSQDRISKKTPLHFAAIMDDVRVAEFLVKEGADINLRTTYNCTALDEAFIQKSTEVKYFLTDLKKMNSIDYNFD